MNFIVAFLSLILPAYSLGGGFVDYCKNTDKMEDVQITIDALAKDLSTKDCNEMDRILKGLESLSIEDEELTNLDALKFFPQLISLTLKSGKALDLSVVQELKLLRGLRVVSPIESFPLSVETLKEIAIIGGKSVSMADVVKNGSIESIRFEYTKVSEMERLGELKALNSFSFWGGDFSKLSDFNIPKGVNHIEIVDSPLSNLEGIQQYEGLETLYLMRNLVPDISPLAALKKLTSLWLNGNPIEDLSPIASLNNIESINLSYLGIENLDFFGEHPALEQIWIMGNELTDIEKLEKFKDLILLNVSRNNLKSIDVVAKLTALQWLWASRNFLTAPIKLPESTFQLDLSHNSIDTLAWMNDLYLPDLEWFEVSANNISDLSPIVKSGLLFYLDFSSNQVSQLPELSNLVGLLVLKGQDNKIADLAPLRTASELYTLDLSRNRIKTVAPIKDIESLTELTLDQNPLGSKIRKTATNCPTDGESVAVTEWCNTKSASRQDSASLYSVPQKSVFEGLQSQMVVSREDLMQELWLP